MKTNWWEKVRTHFDAIRAHVGTGAHRPSALDGAEQVRTTMEQVIENLLANGDYPQHAVDNRLLQAFSPEVHDVLKRELLDLERRALSSANPQRFFCAALLDYTEAWKVMEIASEAVERVGAEDEHPYAEAIAISHGMLKLLAQRFECFDSPHAYWIGRLGSRALRDYLEANYVSRLKFAWWNAYISDVVERAYWLRGVLYSLSFAGISTRGERDILPDDVILDHWVARMDTARTKALEDPGNLAADPCGWYGSDARATRTRWWNECWKALNSFRAYLRHAPAPRRGPRYRPMMNMILASMFAKGMLRRGSRAGHFLREFPAAVHAEFARELLALESSVLASPDPQRFLRAALLDYTEGWQVLETLDDITWGGRKDPYASAMMRSLLAQRFDYARSPPSGYYTHALGAEALHKYLTIRYPDCISPALLDGYINGVIERMHWLDCVLHSLATVGITPSGERSILPDDVILDHWTSWMLDTRTWALEYPVESGRHHQAGEWRF